jgi:hypothetical protein
MRSSSDTRHWPEHEGLDARMTTVAAIVGGATLAAGLYSSSQQAGAAEDAANAQSASAAAGIAEQRRQFDAVQKLLSPYVDAGNKGLAGQLDLTGVNGPDAQSAAIKALQGSPQFKSLLDQGTNSILQNASATGGLRGGNTQGALAQFSPALLAQTINDQYSRLGGITSLGQNAAAGVGNAGMQTGSAVSALLQQQGAAQAGNALAQGRQAAGIANSVTSGIGAYAGLGGFGSFGGKTASTPSGGGGGFGTGSTYGNQDYGGYF